MTAKDSVQALREQTVAKHGKVDILVNCAGVNSATPYEQISDEDWDRVLDTNLKATHWGCQIFAPLMAEQADGGSILNVGSVTSHLPLSRVCLLGVEGRRAQPDQERGASTQPRACA
ncbi:MAG: SDR family oxidoreductase [Bryobacterales bacterium]